jgi:iron complex transport system substrate-binding protein
MIVKNQTVQEIYGAIEQIGRATGHPAEAAKLVESTRQGLARVAARTARLPKIPIVLIVDRTPGTLRDLYAATDNSFLAELVTIAGGRIATKAVARGYAKLNKEDLLAVNPDVILEFVQGMKSRFAGDPMDAWREMPELKAVRNKRIHGVGEDYVPHASQRIVQTAELFARLIHPEAQ